MAFHDLKILAVRPQGGDAVAITFDVPGDAADKFHFTPGQYLTLRAEIGGEDVRRSYSICSPRKSGRLEVGIRAIEGGRFSGFASALKPGDMLKVMPPEGRFVVAPGGGGHDYLLIAAGSGITPMLSIAASVLEEEPESQVTLIYGNRTTNSIMFREELEELKDRYLDRFQLLHVLSREDQDVPMLNGRIDAEKLRVYAEKGIIAPASHDGIYICGPGDMTELAAATRRELGAPDSRIHMELFTPAEGSLPSASERAAKAVTASGQVEVETILDGTRRRFTMDGTKQTVLEAAHEAGVELPFSCAGGMCCTCRCRVSEGKAEMDVNYSLEPWELEAGFVLACQSRPHSEKIILDFDAV